MTDVGRFSSKRQTITFVPAAVKALNELVEMTGEKDTDVVNRAVQVYAFIEKQIRAGKTLKVQAEDGSLETVHIV